MKVKLHFLIRIAKGMQNREWFLGSKVDFRGPRKLDDNKLDDRNETDFKDNQYFFSQNLI